MSNDKPTFEVPISTVEEMVEEMEEINKFYTYREFSNDDGEEGALVFKGNLFTPTPDFDIPSCLSSRKWDDGVEVGDEFISTQAKFVVVEDEEEKPSMYGEAVTITVDNNIDYEPENFKITPVTGKERENIFGMLGYEPDPTDEQVARRLAEKYEEEPDEYVRSNIQDVCREVFGYKIVADGYTVEEY